jgi:aspartyl protease
MPWYDYSTIGGRALPLVEVLLWHGIRHIRFPALVDSGADTSLIDASYAEILGLNRSDAAVEDMATAGGGTIAVLRWSAPLELQFEQDRFPFAGAFVEFPPNADSISLLGRADFFQRYIIQFWDAAELMDIDLSPDFPRAAATHR